ncbi:ribonucleases P/MRP protein subunit POP1-like [Macrobrachium nipponense]|uniref:ribonucleases P/MRP protein subunit POP1-like n=1 Tax=Macrobrachium nipponense TaxID=159736 RepID=UPI0030C7F1D2
MAAAHVPGGLPFNTFLTVRQAEIKSIVKLLEDSDHGRRAFQTLPRHMQRRKVSLNPKRLPRYLLERHRREGGNNAKITRRPSRKYRRRPRLLLEEYNRRQKEFVWLETHIWHSKRFHMIRRWGYALSDESTYKGYRSSIRAAKSSCLAQDISYMCCIELEGSPTAILAGLKRITQPRDLSSITVPGVQQGHQWETVTFFKPDMQPHGALGDVDIMWLPTVSCHADNPSRNVRLWIWVHPSAHNHIVEAVADLYGLVKINSSSDSKDQKNVEKKDAVDVDEGDVDNEIVHKVTEDVKEKELGASIKRKIESTNSGPKKKKCKNVNRVKLALKNIPFDRTPKYLNSSGVSMTLLKDTLCRFRLTGPEAVSVLKAAFFPANVQVENLEDNSIPDGECVGNISWCKDYYCDEDKLQCHKAQVGAWKGLTGSSIKKRMVLPLTVRDPRATLPKKKTPIQQTKGADNSFASIPWPVDSPLYSSEIRDTISLSKEPDCEVNKRRAELLVPGSALPEIPEESKLPILLLTRPSTHAIGYGSGLDVIVCSGWGMSVWLPIVLNGGVAAGQQAEANLLMEFLTPQTPNLLPDTPSGSYYSDIIAQERRVEYFKRPPSCRYNYIKLNIQYPFSCPWVRLVQDWNKGTQNIYVLRNPDLLRYLANCVGDAFDVVRRNKGKQKCPEEFASNDSPAESVDLVMDEINESLQEYNVISKGTDKIKGKQELSKYEELQRSAPGCLVKVKIILDEKGSVEPSAMICLPREEDIEKKIKNEVVEPIQTDSQQEQRAELKREHNRIKRKIHDMKTKTKMKVDQEFSTGGFVQSQPTFKKVTEMALQHLEDSNKDIFEKHRSYNSNMEKLWLMRKDHELQCCSLKIVGYITHGTFSMTIGRGAGIGWVALKPLLDYLHSHKKSQSSNDDADTDIKVNSVLIRNPSSLKYFWGKLFIIK